MIFIPVADVSEYISSAVADQLNPTPAANGETQNFKSIQLNKVYEVVGRRAVETRYGTKVILTVRKVESRSETIDYWAFPRLASHFMSADGTLFPLQNCIRSFLFRAKYPAKYDFVYKKTPLNTDPDYDSYRD